MSAENSENGQPGGRRGAAAGAQAASPRLWHRADRPDPAPLPVSQPGHPDRARRRRGVRRDAAQGRRFALAALPLEHAGVQAVRRRDGALSRRASSTSSSWWRASRCLSAHSLEKLRDLVTDLQLIDGTRGIISLFSARTPPEAGQHPRPALPRDAAGRARLRPAHRTGEIERDPARQASLRGRHAGADRARARARRSPEAAR